MPAACCPPLPQPGSLGGMSQAAAQALFGFDQFEAFHDALTDTRVLLSWREGCLLVAFRGTASRTNAFTDLKLWTTPMLPRRHYGGRLVKVHAGGWVGGWAGGWVRGWVPGGLEPGPFAAAAGGVGSIAELLRNQLQPLSLTTRWGCCRLLWCLLPCDTAAAAGAGGRDRGRLQPRGWPAALPDRWASRGL